MIEIVFETECDDNVSFNDIKVGTFFVADEDFKNMSIKKLWLKVDCCTAVNFSQRELFSITYFKGPIIPVNVNIELTPKLKNSSHRRIGDVDIFIKYAGYTSISPYDLNTCDFFKAIDLKDENGFGLCLSLGLHNFYSFDKNETFNTYGNMLDSVSIFDVKITVQAESLKFKKDQVLNNE